MNDFRLGMHNDREAAPFEQITPAPLSHALAFDGCRLAAEVRRPQPQVVS